MTISEQVDALQAKVAELKSSLDASRHETNEQIKARVATSKAKAQAAQQTVHGKAEQAADHAHTQWQSFKADTSAKMADLQGRIERQRDERDAKAAERDAEQAEHAAANPAGAVLGLDGPDPPCLTSKTRRARLAADQSFRPPMMWPIFWPDDTDLSSPAPRAPS